MSEPALIETGDLIEPLRRMSLLKAGEPARLTPLTGGVSSDISLVEAGGRRFCVKRALPRLKVAALWEAPVERNAAEAAYMRAVAGWAPHAVPRILGEDAKAGWFAMDYLAPEDHLLWKTQLLAGIVEVDFAAAVGRDIAIIHARSAADPNIPAAFANDDTFEAIRIEPYLRATGRAHPELAARFGLADADDAKRALFTATSVRRTFFKARPGRCSSTPNARGSAIPPSILPSVSIISCLRVRARAPTGRATSPLFQRWQAPISLASIGRTRRESKRVQPLCCRHCSSPESMASRRSNTSPARVSARPCAAAPNRWSPIRHFA